MRTLAGPSSSVHFTHLSKNASSALESCFAQHQENSLAAGKTHQIGVLDLMKQYNVSLERVCLLDPRAEREISPEDGDGRFEWFLFGVRITFHTSDIIAYTCLMIQGILGNGIS
jgi:hypothetical protein